MPFLPAANVRSQGIWALYDHKALHIAGLSQSAAHNAHTLTLLKLRMDFKQSVFCGYRTSYLVRGLQENIYRSAEKEFLAGWISQLPKLCKRIEYWCIEYLIFILWVRSFSMRLPSVIFAEEKVLIFLILREKC